MPKSPLGRYATLAALIVSLGTLASWLLLTALESLSIGMGPTDQLTTFAILAFGIVIGQVGVNQEAQIVASEKLNGTDKAINALAKRVDYLGAPPAAAIPDLNGKP